MTGTNDNFDFVAQPDNGGTGANTAICVYGFTVSGVFCGSCQYESLNGMGMGMPGLFQVQAATMSGSLPTC
jgi:hypothetical protein